jgi:hypothetical protein
MVVMATPSYHDASLSAAPEPFEREALVAQPAIEALVGPVLPRLVGLNRGGLDAGGGKPQGAGA